MKKSELKQLIRECIKEVALPPRNQLPPDIAEFAKFVQEKIVDRIRKTGSSRGLENAVIDIITHKMLKDGWTKGGSTPSATINENEFSDNIFVRATGPNKATMLSGHGRWMKVLRIEDRSDSYAVYINGGVVQNVAYTIRKDDLKNDYVPNLEFKVKNVPMKAAEAIALYFSKP